MVEETDGKELTVPVEKSIMGRMFDVFGNTIDLEKPLSSDLEGRNIYQTPPPLAKRSRIAMRIHKN